MLLLPDEILRFPLEQALVIIRGQKVLKVKKFDYSHHPDAKRLVLEKTGKVCTRMENKGDGHC